MGEDALGRGLVHDPPIMVLFLQNAGFHPQVLQGLFVANLRRRAQALDGVRSVLDALHSDRLQSGELVEYIKELPDAKVPLHFRLSNELNIAEQLIGSSKLYSLSNLLHNKNYDIEETKSRFDLKFSKSYMSVNLCCTTTIITRSSVELNVK